MNNSVQLQNPGGGNGPHVSVRTFSFGSSRSRVQSPDGSVEERCTERSSDGSERTTVTRTVRRPDGTQETRTVVDREVGGGDVWEDDERCGCKECIK
jgi:hypothetical protein